MASGFGSETEHNVDGLAPSVALADLNGDGRLDLIVASGQPAGGNINGGSISVLLNTGAGFAPPVIYPPSATSNSQTPRTPSTASNDVTTADVNGDGHLDVIVASEDGHVSVLMNNGDGTFAPAVTYYAVAPAEYHDKIGVQAIDVNGDGLPDLLVGGGAAFQGSTSDDGVALLLNDGKGGFLNPVTYAQGAYVAPTVTATAAFTTADITGDGRPDLVTLSYGEDAYTGRTQPTTPTGTSSSTATTC